MGLGDGSAHGWSFGWWLLAVVSSWVYGMWVTSSVMIRIGRRLGLSSARFAWYSLARNELRPFALPLCIVANFAQWFGVGWDWSDRVMAALLFALWVWLRKDKDDDDRWKKRRKKLVSTVAQMGARLQVVPAGGTT